MGLPQLVRTVEARDHHHTERSLDMGQITVNSLCWDSGKKERAGPVQTPGPWDWGQLPTCFPSRQLICSLTQSPVEKTLTDACCVHALLLGSGNVVTVMALGLVK